jgi:predicted O-methyltransferase YrrM
MDYKTLLLKLSKTELEYLEESAWFEHGSFLEWLISELKPEVFVELGTHKGFSYFTACQAIRTHGLRTKSFAVDTWQGDEHAYYYGDDVFEMVQLENETKYRDFSKLLRMKFDDALPLFSDFSIDLLHIDGFHTFEAVSHDFESWKPKLSETSIVLFHDIHEHREGFGVNQFWNRVKVDFSTFEFIHEHGLGILKYGTGPTPIDFLFEASSDSILVDVIRQIFHSAGVKTTVAAQLKSKDQIIEKYYSNWQKELESSRKLEEAVEVLRSNLEKIKLSISWKVTNPLRTLSSLIKKK